LKTNYQILIIFLVAHFTQRLFLHYLGKTQPAKYHFYLMRYDCLINIKTNYVYISDTLADILSSCPFFNCRQ